MSLGLCAKEWELVFVFLAGARMSEGPTKEMSELRHILLDHYKNIINEFMNPP